MTYKQLAQGELQCKISELRGVFKKGLKLCRLGIVNNVC